MLRSRTLRHSAPISASGWITPISLLTPITDTIAVSGVMAASSCAMSTSPFVCTGRYVIFQPSCSSTRQLSSTHLCSVVVVMTWRFLSLHKGLGQGTTARVRAMSKRTCYQAYTIPCASLTAATHR